MNFLARQGGKAIVLVTSDSQVPLEGKHDREGFFRRANWGPNGGGLELGGHPEPQHAGGCSSLQAAGLSFTPWFSFKAVFVPWDNDK